MNQLIITKAEKGTTLEILAWEEYKHKVNNLYRIIYSQRLTTTQPSTTKKYNIQTNGTCKYKKKITYRHIN